MFMTNGKLIFHSFNTSLVLAAYHHALYLIPTTKVISNIEPTPYAALNLMHGWNYDL